MLGSMAVLWLATAASAQVRRPEVVFEDAQMFHPATDPSRFVSVYDTRNLDPGRYTLGLYLNYAADPIELRLEDSDEDAGEVVESVFGADLVAALGLTENLQLGLGIPYIHTDTNRVLRATSRIEGGGDFLGDITLEAKYTLLPRPPGQGYGFSILPRFTLPTGDRTRFADTGRFGFGGLLLADARYNKINYGLNLGGMIRDEPGQLGGGDDFDDQLFVGTGVTIPTTRNLDIIGEITGRTAFHNSRTNPFEGLVSFRFHWGGLAFTIGGGAGITRSRGAPQWRVVASLTPYIPEREIPLPVAELVTSSRKNWALAVDVDADGRPNPGDTIEYTVTLVNTGTKPAEDVVFIDPLPDRTAFVAGSLTLNGAPLSDAADDDAGDFDATNPGAITVRVGSIPNTEEANTAAIAFRVQVDPDIVDLTVIRNEAIIYHKDQPAQPGTDPETGPRIGERIQVTETTVFPSIRERETVVVTPEKLEITRNIHFEFDKATIRPESFPVLDDVAGVLKDNPQLNILVQGHTDSVGSVQYNQRLSQRRSDSVRDYLVKKGIAAARLDTEGKGESAPIASNETAVGRAMNRRVEFLIVNPEVLKGRRVEKRPFIEDITPESEPAGLEDAGPGGPATGDRATLEAQKALTILGYNAGDPTGIMTRQTANAIEQFQRDNGLPVTGTADAITRKALDEALELQRSR
ncbi:MAG: OmpA family protein [Candidatus Binatia bacterium]